MTRMIKPTRDNRGKSFTTWRRELAINLAGLVTLAAVVVLGSYALRLDAAPTATSVRAYATANGLDYTEISSRYSGKRTLTGGGSGGSGGLQSVVAAHQK